MNWIRLPTGIAAALRSRPSWTLSRKAYFDLSLLARFAEELYGLSEAIFPPKPSKVPRTFHCETGRTGKAFGFEGISSTTFFPFYANN